jgi:hypothetical protein
MLAKNLTKDIGYISISFFWAWIWIGYNILKKRICPASGEKSSQISKVCAKFRKKVGAFCQGLVRPGMIKRSLAAEARPS